MNVLLVYPVFPETYWSFRHALSFVGKKAAFPPLGLLTVSAMLPQTWEKRLVDMNVEKLSEVDIEWADIVFLSAMIVQRESLNEVVKLCKKMGKRVAVGGPFVSTSSELVSEADFIFIGEAETTLPEFIKDLENGTPKRRYEALERPSLALTPLPDFHLIDLDRYTSMNIQFSRGCPFNCEFCDIIEIYGRSPRTKSSEQMIAELEALRVAGWRGTVYFVDDNFIGNKREVRKFLPDLIKWSKLHGSPFSFLTEASVNLAEDDALLQMMQDAGFYRVFLGIETPAPESLKEANKSQNTRRDLLESVKKIQGYGMEVMAGFIVGFDNDPADIFERQIKFIRESAIPLAMVGMLTALPDTQLWRRLEREDRLLNESTGNNTDCSLNFRPKMDRDLLIDGYRSLLKTIYSSKEFYQRAYDCLSRVKSKKAGHGRITITDISFAIKSVVKIVLKLGVRDRDRASFWNYLFHVGFQYPRSLGDGIALAAMGYHFRKVTEVYCEVPALKRS
ncbi:MAG: B12-binding domain-containing radical SAM protein [Acidobacteria bacterium]|nr:B12-binding domain-containing radical SAM protein [Acidobacteriota bacterium]